MAGKGFIAGVEVVAGKGFIGVRVVAGRGFIGVGVVAGKGSIGDGVVEGEGVESGDGWKILVDTCLPAVPCWDTPDAGV